MVTKYAKHAKNCYSRSFLIKSHLIGQQEAVQVLGLLRGNVINTWSDIPIGRSTKAKPETIYTVAAKLLPRIDSNSRWVYITRALGVYGKVWVKSPIAQLMPTRTCLRRARQPACNTPLFFAVTWTRSSPRSIWNSLTCAAIYGPVPHNTVMRHGSMDWVGTAASSKISLFRNVHPIETNLSVTWAQMRTPNYSS